MELNKKMLQNKIVGFQLPVVTTSISLCPSFCFHNWTQLKGGKKQNNKNKTNKNPQLFVDLLKIGFELASIYLFSNFAPQKIHHVFTSSVPGYIIEVIIDS